MWNTNWITHYLSYICAHRRDYYVPCWYYHLAEETDILRASRPGKCDNQSRNILLRTGQGTHDSVSGQDLSLCFHLAQKDDPYQDSGICRRIVAVVIHDVAGGRDTMRVRCVKIPHGFSPFTRIVYSNFSCMTQHSRIVTSPCHRACSPISLVGRSSQAAV